MKSYDSGGPMVSGHTTPQGGGHDKHGALIELAATWCEAQGRAKLDPMAPIWERRAKMLREGYKPQLVSAPSATLPMPVRSTHNTLKEAARLLERWNWTSAASDVRRSMEVIPDLPMIGRVHKAPLTETVARKESIPEAWKINPIGYAVRMKNGPFVGIWQDRATADRVRDKQPASHGDEVIPVWSSPLAEADAAQAKDAARWIPVKERLPDTDKRSTPAVPVLFVLAEEENNVCAGRFHGRGRRLPWRSLQGAAYRLLEVTHWMPLPDGPSKP